MPYDGTSGLYTVFPTKGGLVTESYHQKTGKRAGKSRRSGGRKPAKGKKCRWGPRGEDGRCPTKPRATVGGKTLAKIGGIRATTRGRLSVVDRLIRKGEGRISSLAAGAALAKGRIATTALRRGVAKLAGPGVKGTLGAGIRAIARSPVSALVAKGGARLLGVVALAGIASYAITTKIINVRKKRRLDRAALAAAAADAYRLARLEAASQQGAPLSAEQQRQLAAEFKSQLSDLGLSTTSLKGL